jgi:hypothetical protein
MLTLIDFVITEKIGVRIVERWVVTESPVCSWYKSSLGRFLMERIVYVEVIP